MLKKKIIGVLLSSVLVYFLSILLYQNLISSYGDIRVSRRENYQQAGLMSDYHEELRDYHGNLITEEVEQQDKIIKLHALSAALIDASNGRVLYEKDGYKEVAMASTTKIMTCIIALEYGKLDDIVTVSKYASTMPDVQLNIMPGEKYILKDLLYSLMLESHNDVSVAIAEHISGSVAGFAKLMNEKAVELGCEHTNFVTPNGLDATGHMTTAVELSRIAAYAIQNKDFIDITNTQSWTIREQSKGKVHQVNNKDRFLHIYDGAIGVKTGFTNKAGYCFVGAVKKNGKTFVSSVLASGWPPNKSYKWQDTTNLMNFGVNNFELNEIFNEDKVFDAIKVYEGLSNQVPIYYNGDLSLLMEDNERVRIVYELASYLRAPVDKDMEVGMAKYYIDDELFAEIPIYTSESVASIDMKYCMKNILDKFLMRK